MDRPAWTPALVSLAVLSVLLLWFPLLRATAPSAIAYNEGWNTYWQETTAAGQPLFGEPPSWTIENYPPLSFHFIGLLGRFTGNTNLAGRAVALASFGCVCLLAGMIASRVARTGVAGWYAALCLPVWMGSFAPDRIAMNDPQWLGMVPELLGFFIYFRWPRARPALCLSATLFALSVFTKQNLISCPLSVGVAIVTTRDWKGLCVWSAAGLLTAGLLFGATVGLDGGYFFDHLLRPRAADYAHGSDTDIGYLVLFAPSIILSLFWVGGLIGRQRSRLIAINWIVANCIGLTLAVGHGVASNILFEAIVFTAIIVPIASQALIDRLTSRDRFTGAGILVLCAVWISLLIPSMLTYGSNARKKLLSLEPERLAGVELLRSLPGPAWCEDLLMCHAAGKAMIFDAYFVQDQIETGKLPECDILKQIIAQRPVAIEIGAPPDRKPPSPDARLRFTSRFMQTLLRHYAPRLRARDFTILTPISGDMNDDGTCQ